MGKNNDCVTRLDAVDAFGSVLKWRSMQIAIRLALSAFLLYFVWRETGAATTTAIGLITIGNEISSYTIKKILESIKLLAGR